MAAFGILAISKGLPDLAFSYYSNELISLVRATLIDAEASALKASKSESLNSSIAVVNHPSCDYETLEPVALLRAYTAHPRIGLLQLAQIAERIPQVSLQHFRYLRVSAGCNDSLHLAIFQQSDSVGNMDHGYTFFVLSNDRYCTPQRVCSEFECFLQFVNLLYGPFWEEFLIVPSSSLRRIAVSGTAAEKTRALIFFQTLFDYHHRSTIFRIESPALLPPPASQLSHNPPLITPEELEFSPRALLGALEVLQVDDEILRTICPLLERLHPLLQVLSLAQHASHATHVLRALPELHENENRQRGLSFSGGSLRGASSARPFAFDGPFLASARKLARSAGCDSVHAVLLVGDKLLAQFPRRTAALGGGGNSSDQFYLRFQEVHLLATLARLVLEHELDQTATARRMPPPTASAGARCDSTDCVPSLLLGTSLPANAHSMVALSHAGRTTSSPSLVGDGVRPKSSSNADADDAMDDAVDDEDNLSSSPLPLPEEQPELEAATDGDGLYTSASPDGSSQNRSQRSEYETLSSSSVHFDFATTTTTARVDEEAAGEGDGGLCLPPLPPHFEHSVVGTGTGTGTDSDSPVPSSQAMLRSRSTRSHSQEAGEPAPVQKRATFPATRTRRARARTVLRPTKSSTASVSSFRSSARPMRSMRDEVDASGEGGPLALALEETGVPHCHVFVRRRPFNAYFFRVHPTISLVVLLPQSNLQIARIILKAHRYLLEAARVLESGVDAASLVEASGSMPLDRGVSAAIRSLRSSQALQLEALGEDYLGRIAAFFQWKSSERAKSLEQLLARIKAFIAKRIERDEQQRAIPRSGLSAQQTPQNASSARSLPDPDSLRKWWEHVKNSVARAQEDIRLQSPEHLGDELDACKEAVGEMLKLLTGLLRALGFVRPGEFNCTRVRRTPAFCRLYSFVRQLLETELAPYAQFLAVRSPHNLTISSLRGLPQFCGLVHFTYLNRTQGVYVAPSLSLHEYFMSRREPEWLQSPESLSQSHSHSMAELEHTPALVAELRVGLLWFEQCVAQGYAYGRLERGGLCFTFQCWTLDEDESPVPPLAPEQSAPPLHALVAPFESRALAAAGFTSPSPSTSAAAASARGLRERPDLERRRSSSGSDTGAPSGNRGSYPRTSPRAREQLHRVELFTFHLAALPRERIHKQMTDLFDLIIRDYRVSPYLL